MNCLQIAILILITNKSSTFLLAYQSSIYLTKNKTQTAVINIVNKRILINLTFRMLANIHLQKYKPLQCLKTVYIVYNKGLEPRLRKTLLTVI